MSYGLVLMSIAVLMTAILTLRIFRYGSFRFSSLPGFASPRRALRGKVGNMRGDTLIEVTIALAILTAVLTGAFVISNKAFQLGQTSKERSQLISAAQQQSEALKNFRDSQIWNVFVNGNGLNSTPGIVVRNISGDCDGDKPGIQNCFHMEQRVIGGVNQWVPATGAVTSGNLPPGNSIWITTPAIGFADNYDFEIVYRADSFGPGISNRGSIRQHLTNLDQLR